MLDRLPFEIPSFVTMDDLTFALGKTTKGVKAQATREQWRSRVAPDGSIIWAMYALPSSVRKIVIYKLLEHDGKNHDFCLLVAKEFSAVAPSLNALRNRNHFNDGWFEAALWCRRLQIVDDIMVYTPDTNIAQYITDPDLEYTPNLNFRIACIDVACATGVGWDQGIERLTSLADPLTENELSILDMDRSYWLAVIYDRLKRVGIYATPQQEPAQILDFSPKSIQSEAEG